MVVDADILVSVVLAAVIEAVRYSLDSCPEGRHSAASYHRPCSLEPYVVMAHLVVTLVVAQVRLEDAPAAQVGTVQVVRSVRGYRRYAVANAPWSDFHEMGLRWAVLEAVETCHSSSTVDAAGSVAFRIAWFDSPCLAEVAAVAAGQPGQARRLTCRLVAENEDPCLRSSSLHLVASVAPAAAAADRPSPDSYPHH